MSNICGFRILFWIMEYGIWILTWNWILESHNEAKMAGQGSTHDTGQGKAEGRPDHANSG